MEYTGEFIGKLKQRQPDAIAILYKDTGQMIYNYILYRARKEFTRELRLMYREPVYRKKRET